MTAPCPLCWRALALAAYVVMTAPCPFVLREIEGRMDKGWLYRIHAIRWALRLRGWLSVPLSATWAPRSSFDFPQDERKDGLGRAGEGGPSVCHMGSPFILREPQGERGEGVCVHETCAVMTAPCPFCWRALALVAYVVMTAPCPLVLREIEGRRDKGWLSRIHALGWALRIRGWLSVPLSAPWAPRSSFDFPQDERKGTERGERGVGGHHERPVP